MANRFFRRLRESGQPQERVIVPHVDIFEDKDEIILMADMPGVSKDGVQVLLEGNELTIIGRRPEEPSEVHYLIKESRPGVYRRTFRLDPCIDTSKIRAHIEQGVLTIHLPKAEAHKARKIEVCCE